MSNLLNVNDVLCAKWGYDQTNVDFYQVLHTTDKTVTLIKIAREVIENDNLPMVGKVKPILNKFIGEKIKRKVKKNLCSDKMHVKIDDYTFAEKYENNKNVEFTYYS